MNWQGILVGICSFLIIGLFHPLVVKGEYYLGQRSKWLFGICGVLTLAGSLLCSNNLASILLGVVGFSCLWSIKEVKEQKQRVERGWFPRNPNRRSN